ncbi:MAG: type II secretion system F family protein [Deltaproteobacteria bacterium]|nr:type II secretion system F family protein [Deltaproteobacteria bacterium]
MAQQPQRLRRLHLASADRAVLHTQLARLLQSGVAWPEALDLAGDVLGGSAAAAARTSAHTLRGGGGLGEALAASGLFDAVDLALVAAGDRTGRSVQCLQRSAERHARTAELWHGLRGSLGYPVFVVLSACVLLPAPQLFISGLGGFLRSAGFNLAVFAGLAGAVVLAVRRAPGSPWLARAMAVAERVPLIDRAIGARRCALVFEVLAHGLHAGIALPDAMGLAAAASGDPVGARWPALAVAGVQSSSLSAAIAAVPGVTQRARATVAAAERSGHLPETFSELAAEARTAVANDLRIFTLVLRAMLGAAVAVAIGWQVVSQVRAMTSDPFALVPGAEGDELRREIDRNMPSLRKPASQ